MVKTLNRIKHLSWLIKTLLRIILLFLPFGHLRPVYPKGNGFKLHKTNFGEDGQVFYLKWDRVVAPLINRFGFYDILTVNFLSNHLNANNTKHVFLDIGANQGCITLQLARQLKFPNSCRIHCIEPSSEYFINLKKNVRLTDKSLDITLHNFGLSGTGNMISSIWKSNRNATATEHKSLSLDSSENLYSEKVKMVQVNSFVASIADSLLNKTLTIKSDTDGSDVTIFNAFLASQVSTNITCYVLEIILIDLDEKSFEMFIHNCHKFSEWTLKFTNNEMMKSKLLIEELFRSDRNLRGDLFLIK
jgi:FkbM family methyltransferase